MLVFASSETVGLPYSYSRAVRSCRLRWRHIETLGFSRFLGVITDQCFHFVWGGMVTHTGLRKVSRADLSIGLSIFWHRDGSPATGAMVHFVFSRKVRALGSHHLESRDFRFYSNLVQICSLFGGGEGRTFSSVTRSTKAMRRPAKTSQWSAALRWQRRLSGTLCPGRHGACPNVVVVNPAGRRRDT